MVDGCWHVLVLAFNRSKWSRLLIGLLKEPGWAVVSVTGVGHLARVLFREVGVGVPHELTLFGDFILHG